MTRTEKKQTGDTAVATDLGTTQAKARCSRSTSCRCGQQLDMCARAHCPRCGRSLRRG